jgi:hypothetical protein
MCVVDGDLLRESQGHQNAHGQHTGPANTSSAVNQDVVTGPHAIRHVLHE